MKRTCCFTDIAQPQRLPEEILLNRSRILILTLLLFGACTQKKTIHWLDDLKIQSFSEGIPSVSAKKNQGGDSIRIAGHRYERGIGVQSVSVLSFLLDGKAMEFTALAGADDRGNPGMKAQFYVVGDEKILFESGPVKVGDQPKKVKVNLAGIRRMGLLVTVDLEDEGYGKTYSDWADARLVMQEGFEPQTIPNSDEKYILTPPPAKTPRINSAGLLGATPGNPFLYTIAASGEKPVSFRATNLPAGLSLDENTGIIRGKVSKRGTYHATLEASNSFGKSEKALKIVIGDTIALTPPIGWNGWNS